MIRNGWKWLTGLALAGLTPVIAQAEPPEVSPPGIASSILLTAEADPAPATDKDRIARLEAELAQIKAVVGGGGQASAPGVNCNQDSCCKHGGWVTGFEIIFLEPHNSAGVAPIFDLILGSDNPEFGYEPTWRLWLGYEFAGGLGVRARYWEFDHSTRAVFGGGAALFNYALLGRTLDLEVTDRFQVGKCNCLISAGYRYVEYKEENLAIFGGQPTGLPVPQGLPPISGFGTGFQSQSHGLIGGLELYRPVGQSRINLFALGRASVLFGDEDETIGIGGLGQFTEREGNNTKAIWETQLGAEWTRQTQRGAKIFVRAALEGQYWDHFSGVPIIGDNASVGFFGVALGVGIHR